MRNAASDKTNKAKATKLHPNSYMLGPFSFSTTAFPALNELVRERMESVIGAAEYLIMRFLNLINHVALLIVKPANLLPDHE